MTYLACNSSGNKFNNVRGKGRQIDGRTINTHSTHNNEMSSKVTTNTSQKNRVQSETEAGSLCINQIYNLFV